MLEQAHNRTAGHAMAPLGASAVAIAIFLPGAALCAAAAGPVWPIRWAWCSWDAANAMTLAVTLVGAAIFRLMLMDWLAEIRSRASWASLADLADKVPAATPANGLDQSKDIYPPQVGDRAVLHARRQAALPALESAAELGSSDGVGQVVQRKMAARVPGQLHAIAGELHCSQTPPSRVGEKLAHVFHAARVSAGAEEKQELWIGVHLRMPVMSASRSKRHAGSRLGMGLRRVISASAGGAWSEASAARLRVTRIPIKIVSDRIVLGQSDKGPSETETSTGSQPINGCPIRAGPRASMDRSRTLRRVPSQRPKSAGVEPSAVAHAPRYGMEALR